MADVLSLSDKVIIISSIITAITTVIIALYAIFSHRLAKRIERQAQTNQDMFHELLLSITSATLVAGKTIGESELATRLFREQKEKLRKEIIETNNSYRDRDTPHRAPLPHHAAYGSVLRDSADQAKSDPGKLKAK